MTGRALGWAVAAVGRLSADTRGAAALEFAVIAVPLLTLIVGIVPWAIVFAIQAQQQFAVAELTRIVAAGIDDADRTALFDEAAGRFEETFLVAGCVTLTLEQGAETAVVRARHDLGADDADCAIVPRFGFVPVPDRLEASANIVID